MPNANKAKGTYYENKLLKELHALGLEAWKVPSSGALGHNPKVKVPDRVRKYLVGDLCVNLYGRDTAVEVKYREVSPFTVSVSASIKAHVASKSCSTGFSDATIFYSIDAWLHSIKPTVNYNVPCLNATITPWLANTKVLFIRSKAFKDWIILELP